MKIPLVRNIIDKKTIEHLTDWLSSEEIPQLTQGKMVEKFEQEFSKWQDIKYSVFVNSGSSANLLLAYYYKEFIDRKNRTVIIPALSWSTTLAPFLQFGMNVYLCDADKDCLGLDLNHLEDLLKKYNPGLVFAVNVLGFPNKFDELTSLCNKYEALLYIDDCEDAGSKYKNKRCGNFGELSTKSFFASHLLFSTEGGMLCTNDNYTYNVLKMLRSHGWNRNVSPEFSAHLKKEYGTDDFNENFTFYIPGFNLRSTEISSVIALENLQSVDQNCINKSNNFKYYQEHIKNDYWKPNPIGSFVSNFSYPIITPKREQLLKALKNNEIDCRPLIAGNLGNHPMWKEHGTGEANLPFADIVHKFGLYIPNLSDMTQDELKFVCEVANKAINE